MATSQNAVIAVNRFGLGARPGELAHANSDPHGWLAEQIKGNRSMPEAIASLPSSSDVFKKYVEAQNARRAEREEQRDQASEATQAQQVLLGVRQVLMPMYLDQVAARYRVAANTGEPFRERLTHFWTNHFAVSADKVAVIGLAGTLENEAVRPNLGKRFVDMLLAVERHPAMILYLDNQQSMGPNSPLARFAARRRNQERKIGINENLAREILELHTLGVNGGYTQTDVTTFAQAITGWSIGGGRGRVAQREVRGEVQGEPGKYVFRAGLHEPGPKTILGKRYAQDGEAQGEAVLLDLARHPATATFIATKLVRHFVQDDPPHAVVEKIAKAFRDSDGDLPTLHRAVAALPQAWAADEVKFKTPHDFVTSTFRALDYIPKQPAQVVAPFQLLGQRPFTPGSPAGWPDTANQWDGADALMKRIEWATQVGQRAGPRVQPVDLANQALGSALSDHTATAIARASSAAQALTLLLMSPEFQRR